MPVHVLLAGGAGFMGKNLAACWTARFPKDEVVVVDTLRRHRADVALLEGLGVEVVEGDVTDLAFVEHVLLDHHIGLVVNLASVASVTRAAADPQAAVRSNVSTAVSLLEACRRVGDVRLHHVSSAEVFGSASTARPVPEEAPYTPGTVYGASKAGADHLVRAYHECYGVPVTISIAPNTYGPYQCADQVLPRFVINAILGDPLPIYGAGDVLREWLHISDHCSGIVAIARDGRPGATYNLASGELLTVAAVAQSVLGLLGRPPSLVGWLPDRPGNRSRPALDGSTAAEDLGWQATVPFAEGLRRTVEWYLANRDWWLPPSVPALVTSATSGEAQRSGGGR